MTQPSATSGRLHGKAIVVTGATSGIGLVTATRLHAKGACVLVTGRDVEAGRQLARSLDERVHFVAADLTEPGAPTVVVDGCRDAFGGIDGVVNTFAAIAMVQAGAAAMERGGSIVNVTSRLAVAGCRPWRCTRHPRERSRR
ncbi:SDR family NAD(P)-dependent oxidoreductase [Mycobacterium sp. MBM]|nr:SDR family NAD(P)-dependent oxidoreductase [Mycobacterium sp. MBM]